MHSALFSQSSNDTAMPIPLPLSPIQPPPVFDDDQQVASSNSQENNDNIFSPPPPPAPPPPPPPPMYMHSSQQRTTLRERIQQRPPRIPRLRRLAATDPRYYTNNDCAPDQLAVNIDPLITASEGHAELDFRVAMHDGGYYGPSYGVENVLRNDCTVFCSSRSGTVNILLEYNGRATSRLLTDTSCVVSQVIVKSPQFGFTAPCKEGLIFTSRHPISIERSRIFDQFTRCDYEQYMRYKTMHGNLDDDLDPVAWFSISKDRHEVVRLNDRSARFILVKLLRSEHEADNIDLQYIGLIGYSGPRAFASGQLC